MTNNLEERTNTRGKKLFPFQLANAALGFVGGFSTGAILPASANPDKDIIEGMAGCGIAMIVGLKFIRNFKWGDVGLYSFPTLIGFYAGMNTARYIRGIF